jgi:hypothetical protein
MSDNTTWKVSMEANAAHIQLRNEDHMVVLVPREAIAAVGFYPRPGLERAWDGFISLVNGREFRVQQGDGLTEVSVQLFGTAASKRVTAWEA